MTPKDCKYFDTCSASLCPLDNNRGAIWYPDEPICKSHKHHQSARWVQNQRKVAKRAKDTETCYNRDMLNRDIIIRTGIEGANPDAQDFEAEVKKWIRNHPERTAEQKARAKHRGNQLKKTAPAYG